MGASVVSNLLFVKIPVSGATIVFECHGGNYNCPSGTVSIDGANIVKTADIVDFVRTRSYVTATVYGIDTEHAVARIARCERVELVTADEPYGA